MSESHRELKFRNRNKVCDPATELLAVDAGLRRALRSAPSAQSAELTSHRSRLRNLRGFAVDVARQFNVTPCTVPSVRLTLQRSASWRSHERYGLLDIPQKRLSKRRQRTVSMRRRGLLGIRRSNRHGSLNRCFRRKFSRHLRKPQRQPLQSGLEYCAGTLATSERAAAHIRGAGKRWRDWRGCRRTVTE